MNIILFEKEERIDGHVVLNDHRAKHIIKVLRCKTGDSVKVGEVNGDIGTAEILSIKPKYPFVVELRVNLFQKASQPSSIDLILALPRPIMLKRILSQVTALGVGTIHLINANRVEKSFWDAGILNEEEYRPHLIHGLEQAVDTRLPEIKIHRYFTPFVEEYLLEMKKKYGSLIIAHPDTENALSHALSKNNTRILYAIGPEGGWVDYEVEKFLLAGVKPFSIGPRILKVDTAVVSIHGRICQEIKQ